MSRPTLVDAVSAIEDAASAVDPKRKIGLQIWSNGREESVELRQTLLDAENLGFTGDPANKDDMAEFLLEQLSSYHSYLTDVLLRLKGRGPCKEKPTKLVYYLGIEDAPDPGWRRAFIHGTPIATYTPWSQGTEELYREEIMKWAQSALVRFLTGFLDEGSAPPPRLIGVPHGPAILLVVPEELAKKVFAAWESIGQK